MYNKYTKSYIQELLVKASNVDIESEVFGASKQGYKLAPPVSMNEIKALEAEFNIKFPDEFVYFYTEIGNGGAGLYYGLYSLEELSRNQYCMMQDEMINPLIDINLTKEIWRKLLKILLHMRTK